MAVQDGHGKIATAGLVFAYDVKDTVNSYIGEPTQNLATDSPFRGGWPGSSTLIDSETKTFDFVTSSIEWGGNAAWSTFYYDVSEYRGQYMTISAEVVGFDESNGTFSFIWIGQTINDETYLGYSPEADRNQKTTKTPERISWSGIIGSGGKVGILIWMNNSSGEPGSTKVRFSNIQVELKPHPTVFTSAERSVTQSLIDLTRTNDINLSNVSFNSNSQMIFDGTDDKIHSIPAAHSHLLSSSIEFIVRPAVNHKRMMVGGYRHNEGYSSPTIGAVWISSDNTFNAHVITAAEVYRGVTSSTLILPNQTYHIVFNKNTSTGSLQLFINGALESTNTFDTATYAQWSSAGSYIGSDYLDLGKSFNTSAGQGWNSDFLAGKLEVVKLYSRTLTQAEVSQNFKTYRRKYSID